MKNLKLVVLDYALKQKEKPLVRRLLNDIIFVKQENFERTDPNYVVLDKHDMIGTHFLIFDTTDIYQPQLIYGIRVTYESRAKTHKIKTPVQDLKLHLGGEAQSALQDFSRQYPELIEVNSLFVAPDYSIKNSGLHLSDIGFSMIFLQLARMGHGHFVCCPNERYKAHRLVENIGHFRNNRGYDFVHPVVKDPHMLIMVDSFKKDFIQQVVGQHEALFDDLLDVSPEACGYSSIAEVINYSFHQGKAKKAG